MNYNYVSNNNILTFNANSGVRGKVPVAGGGGGGAFPFFFLINVLDPSEANEFVEPLKLAFKLTIDDRKAGLGDGSGVDVLEYLYFSIINCV